MANPAISPDRIGDVGRQLFGDHWQAPLSKALGISPRQLRYWLSGEEAPDRERLLNLLALLEHASAEGHRLASHLRVEVGAPPADRDDWAFGPDQLRRLDRHTVEHIPTRSRIYFYDYVDPPPGDFVPGGTITNADFWAPVQMAKFQRAAWTLLSNYRYGPDIREVRRVLRGMMNKVLISQIVKELQRENSFWTESRVRTALKEMVADGEIAWVGVQGVERLPNLGGSRRAPQD